MNCIILIIYILSVATNLMAATYVDGEVSGVWDEDGSPYIVEDYISLQADDTLCISEGVEVFFSRYSLFKVYGSLIVEGSAGNPVLFDGIEDGYWIGFYVSDDAFADISYAIIRSAKGRFDGASNSDGAFDVFWDESDQHGDITLNNCKFDRGVIAVHASGGQGENISNIRIIACEFLDVSRPILISPYDKILVRNCIFFF